jgi:hypothetical protein
MSLSLNIKRTFLSFAQHFFRDVPSKYTWNPNPKTTGIFIGDKFSQKAGTLEKYPAIILTENQKRWARTSIDQRQKYQGFGVDNSSKVRSDLVLGSVTYQCLSPNGVEAEMVADVLFNMLVASKDVFRSNHINQLLDIQMGEEQPLRVDATGRVFMVPVTVYYSTQNTIITVVENYDLRVYTDGFGTSYLQSIIGIQDPNNYAEYSVSGQSIIFNSPLVSGLSVYARYLDAITLEERNETVGPGDGTQNVYTLQHVPYSYNYMLNHIEIT